MSGNAVVRHYLPGGRESGGIGRMVGYLIDAAAAEGETHFVTDTRGPILSPIGSPIRLLQALLMLAWDRAAAPGRIQHVHVAGRGSTVRKVILTTVAQALGATYVLHLHDYGYAKDFARRPTWQRRLVTQMFRRATRVIVLGRRDWETVVGVLGVDPCRVVTLPNAVPEPKGHAASRAGSIVTIVFLGQLGTRKGVPELLTALASPPMAMLGWRAVLAGDGAVEEYRVETVRLGLSQRVELAGWLPAEEASRLLAAADILVLPSREEGLSMAVLEGLAHGLAVVTTRVGAHEEVITDGDTGLFVPVGDAMALADVLSRLVADAPARARLSSAGCSLHRRCFDMTSYLRAVREVYQNVRPAHPNRHSDARPVE